MSSLMDSLPIRPTTCGCKVSVRNIGGDVLAVSHDKCTSSTVRDLEIGSLNPHLISCPCPYCSPRM